jgi:magnesium-transporting ATPase (P-type)
MLDFDEEAMEILKSEQGRATTKATANAVFALIILGVVPIGFLVWDLIKSFFFGARFSSLELWGTTGLLLGVFVLAWIYYRLSGSWETGNTRLIRIELKLDRLLTSQDSSPASK